MNIKLVITLSVLLPYAFIHTVHADQITNAVNDSNQQTQIVDQLETDNSSETIDGEQNNINDQSLSKQNIVGITLLLGLHGYVMSTPFIPEQYIVHGKWSFALPLTFIIGVLLLSDRMSDTATDIPDCVSTDSSENTQSIHDTNRSFTDMYPPFTPMTPTYTPTFTPMFF